MANIAITNYCNLQCPYCFADDIKKDPPQNMSQEEFQQILNFVDGYEPINILGGEPTLHPQFDIFLAETFKYCITYNINATVFTNGAFLKKYLKQIESYSDWMNVLLNFNSPQYQSEKSYQEFLKLIKKIYSQDKYHSFIFLGCTIHLGCDNYDFVWDVVKKYHIENLRVSVASPGGIFLSCRDKKEWYYETLKNRFIQFVDTANQNDVTLSFDCNQVPKCYLTQKELQIINLNNQYYDDIQFCDSAIDILMGGKAVPCFGNYHPINYKDFANTYEIRRYFAFKTNYDATVQNDDGKCASCKQFKYFQCQGGCLAFSKINRTSSD